MGYIWYNGEGTGTYDFRLCSVGPLLVKKDTELKCDNLGLVDAINKGSSRDKMVMHLRLCLWFFTAFFNIRVTTTHIRYRSIITSLLHASPRAVHVESAKSYRGKLRFHVTGRGFSTRRLVAFHDTWHFHETSREIFTRPIVVALKSQWLVKAFTI